MSNFVVEMTTSAKTRGYIFAAVAAATYGMNPLFALPLYADGMNADSVLLFRYLMAMPVLAVMLRLRGHRFSGLTRRQLGAVAVLGIVMALSSLLLFLAYNYMEAGIASTILFVYPIMVAAIGVVCFHEKLTAMTVLCIALAVGGIALLYTGGEGGATLSAVGTLIVIASALSYSIYIVGVDRPILHGVATLRLTFYLLGFGSLLFIARVTAMGNLTVPTHWTMWGNLLCLALFPTVISFICTTKAVQYIGATPTAILGALEPVTAVIIGICVFGETLTPGETLGLVLIIAAVTFVVAGGSITAPLVRFRKLFPRILHRQ